jgi:hypothetical protein
MVSNKKRAMGQRRFFLLISQVVQLPIFPSIPIFRGSKDLFFRSSSEAQDKHINNG